MNQTKPKYIKYLIIGVVVVVLFSFGGNQGYKYAKNYLKDRDRKKDSTILALNDTILIMQEKRTLETDTVYIDIENANNYYYGYIERGRKIEDLQDYILVLDSNNYTKQQLDSLAEYITYE